MSDNGLIEPGYLGRNFAQPEPYGWRGQAVWSAVGLVFLAIPPDNSFWTEQEKPLPVDNGSGIKVLRGAQMVIKWNAATGSSRVYKIGDPFDHRGRYQRAAKYFGHAYSSDLGFIVTGEGGPELVANSSAASSDGLSWSFRDNPRPLKISDFENVSAYPLKESVTDTQGEVITHTFIGRHGEIHVLYHTADKPLYLSLGGYGIQVRHGEKAQALPDKNSLTVSAGRNHSRIIVLGGIEGKLEMRTVEPRPEFEHSHLFGGSSAFPVWTASQPVPRCTPIVLYVNGARGKLPEEEAYAQLPVENQVELQFEGKTTYLTVLNNYWAE